MYISRILHSNKQHRQVATTSANDTVMQAAQSMCEKGVGSLVVVGKKGTLDGIVTERDILRCFARHGSSMGDMQVADIMTRHVETSSRDAEVDDLLTRMTHKRFRHLPIVEDGKLVGLVSIGDLVKAALEEKTSEAESLRQYITS